MKINEKANKRSKEESTEDKYEKIIKANRIYWFSKALKERKIFSKRLVDGYSLYINEILQNEVNENYVQDLTNFDFGKEFKELIDFLIWQDENLAVKDSERFLNFQENQ